MSVIDFCRRGLRESCRRCTSRHVKRAGLQDDEHGAPSSPYLRRIFVNLLKGDKD
jgi:hypothetical protein